MKVYCHKNHGSVEMIAVDYIHNKALGFDHWDYECPHCGWSLGVADDFDTDYQTLDFTILGRANQTKEVDYAIS